MSEAVPRKDLRNLEIIAHVDHGKTTLVDGLLRFTGAVWANRPVVVDSRTNAVKLREGLYHSYSS
jgi:GTP-binding protein